jgi:2-amino-4-hydroxy-6-hydroxymethyldihydropteridine diphosphokinase
VSRSAAATDSRTRVGEDSGPARRRCWISVGSNVDRERSIRGAVEDLRAAYGELVISPVYETDAVGFEGAPFLNLVIGIETETSVGAINRRLREIEDARGRVRGPNKFAPRTLDLDLLTYGRTAGEVDGCVLPRDEILKYPFVLAPLADVAPRERHPEDGRSYGDLWRAMACDSGPLRRVDLPLD